MRVGQYKLGYDLVCLFVHTSIRIRITQRA